MVSFLEESSSDDDDEEQAPLTPPHKENFPTLPVLNQSEYHVNIPERKIRLRRQPPIITRAIPTNIVTTTTTANSPIKIPEIKSFPKLTKKPSWFKNLFLSNNNNNNKPKNRKSEIFSGLFTSNNTYPIDHKKTLKKKKEKVQRIPLITRYPLDTERAVYQLSHLKLNNIRRPLQQQVVISNMMYWYLSITEQIEYQPVQEDHQKPPLTHVSSVTEYQQPAHEQQGGQRPASPPSPPLNDVSTKSSKKKYKPVPNTDYVSRQK
ncbi:activator of mitotic machinery Cdc14 phosphatase activation C-term-domain-containing protein [Thamnidium elegans]|nr:activator of mitotic machinery Cdc14 phosphatase activation C-term-domain-containing protein [Thamnidium elegans]